MPEVSPDFARQCMRNFDRTVRGNDLATIHRAFTSYVTFSAEDMLQWMNETGADSFRVGFGIYPPSSEEGNLARDHDAGRMTTFVWAIVNGEETSVFNSGESFP